MNKTEIAKAQVAAQAGDQVAIDVLTKAGIAIESVEKTVDEAVVVEEAAIVVASTEPTRGQFTGIVSASRTIVEPTIDTNGEVTKQGLVIITARQGDKKVTFSIGTAFLGAIDAFKNIGIIDQSIEVEYENCIKDVTTYEDADNNPVKHTFTGKRVVTLEPMGEASYVAYCIAEEKRANLALLKDFGATTSDMVAYLTGSAV